MAHGSRIRETLNKYMYNKILLFSRLVAVRFENEFEKDPAAE